MAFDSEYAVESLVRRIRAEDLGDRDLARSSIAEILKVENRGEVVDRDAAITITSLIALLYAKVRSRIRIKEE